MSRQRTRRADGNGLPFKEITSRLNTEELIKRLKGCLSYLEDINELNPDTISQEQLISLSLTLLSPSIINNKSKEVLALTGVVLANLYRLFYPDIPHNEKQMKVVFRLFIFLFESLKKPTGSLFKWTYSLLEMLSAIRLFTVCVNFDTQEVLVELFSKILECIIPDQQHQIEQFLLDIMSSVIQDAEQLSQQLVDTLLSPLIEPNKTHNKLQYSFICKLLKKSSQYLEPFIQIFFANAFTDDGESVSSLSTSVYELITELHVIDNHLLLSVLPQLEYKLNSPDSEERLKVTQLLGPMFSLFGSHLTIENKPLWNCYLGRCHDISSSVRVEVIKEFKNVLINHSHLRPAITDKLSERLVDHEESVRQEAIKTIIDVINEDITCISDQLLVALQERMRDKKWSVRNYTLMGLAKLYKNKPREERLDWIPNKLLHSYYQPFKEDKLCITRCLMSCVIPAGLEPKDKVNILLNIYHKIDDNADKAFLEILKVQTNVRSHVLSMIRATDKDNDITVEERKRVLYVKCAAIASCLPDPLKAQESLRELQSLLVNDEVVRNKLYESINVNNDYQNITSAKHDLYSHLSSNQLLLEIVKIIIDISSPLLIDRSCVTELTERISKELVDPSLRDSEEEEEEEQIKCKKGLQLLKVLSGMERVWFYDETTLSNILSLLRHKDNETVNSCIIIMNNIGSVLSNEYNNIASALNPLLFQLASKGSPTVAKSAVLCLLSVFPESVSCLERLYELLVSGLDIESDHVESVLVSLSVLALYKHRIFERQRNNVIHKFAVEQILDKDEEEEEEEEESDDHMTLWSSDADMSQETRLKIVSMKLLVSWIIGFPVERVEDRNKAVKLVIRLLTRTITDGGDLHNRRTVSPPERSRLRLSAGINLLRLSTVSSINEIMSVQDLTAIATVSQDPCDEVRDGFIKRLTKKLKSFSLPLRYMSLYSLSCLVETRKQIKLNLRQTLSSIINMRRKAYEVHSSVRSTPSNILPEYSLPFVIYLLSHHSLFRRIDHKSLEMFRDCLWFYIEPLITRSDNFQFLCKMIDSMKQMVDAECPNDDESNKDMYAVCDLASGVLQGKVGKGAVGNFPGEVVLPKMILKQRKKGSPPNDVKYLPPDFTIFPDKMNKIDAMLRSPVPVRESVPVKRGRPPKKRVMADSSSVNSSLIISDAELTPSPGKRKRGVSSKGPSTKQTKLTFKAKAPVTSTPITDGSVKPKAPSRQSTRLKKNELHKLVEEQETSGCEADDAVDISPPPSPLSPPSPPPLPSPLHSSPPHSSPPPSPPPPPTVRRSPRKRTNESSVNDTKISKVSPPKKTKSSKVLDSSVILKRTTKRRKK